MDGHDDTTTEDLALLPYNDEAHNREDHLNQS